MGIDDIAREKAGGAGAGDIPRSVNERNSQRSTQTASNDAGGQSSDTSRPSATRGNGTIQLELPDPLNGDREAMLFWMNVVQTLALVYLVLRR